MNGTVLRRALPRPRRLPILYTAHFHSSPAFAATVAREPSHYDILNLPLTATASEIKRRYYELSKAHHPDRNPNDPHASSRFTRVSDAYGILGNIKKREKYDRELAKTHGIPHHGAGPAGGRPASGLSRRRTQFYGPPPSFYKNGAWGANTERARAATSGANFFHGASGFGFAAPQSGRNDDVPHFDFEAHRMQQERRKRRPPEIPFELRATRGTIIPLVGVTTLLVAAVGIANVGERGAQVIKQNQEGTG